jgi:hypothetical protein
MKIEKETGIRLQRKEHRDGHHGEYYLEGVGYVDGYHHETKTVYEYHGSYWHGDPRIYPSEGLNKSVGKTFGELYRETLKRDDKIRALGYRLITKWERN